VIVLKIPKGAKGHAERICGRRKQKKQETNEKKEEKPNPIQKESIQPEKRWVWGIREKKGGSSPKKQEGARKKSVGAKQGKGESPKVA